MQNARQIGDNNRVLFSLGDWKTFFFRVRKTFFFGVKKTCRTFEGTKQTLRRITTLRRVIIWMIQDHYKRSCACIATKAIIPFQKMLHAAS
jgi:hypothetical protein